MTQAAIDINQGKKLFESLLPILRMFGLNLDPRAFGRDKVTPFLDAAVPDVVDRFEKAGFTPAVKAATDEGDREWIKAALFHTLKYALKHLFDSLHLPGPAKKITDFIADRGADRVRDDELKGVLAIAAPQLDVGDSTEAGVRLVIDALLQRVF
jgi:hypothetical protein